MRIFPVATASVSLLLVGVFGAPERLRKAKWARSHEVKPPTLHSSRSSDCMDDDEAQQVATNFQNLIVIYSDSLANSSLSEDFVDYSDSVIELINNGCPNSVQDLGTAAFDSRAAFMEGQAAQPSIPWSQLNIWHTCTSVTVRWLSAGDGQQITGIAVLEAEYSSGSWIINKVYSEFNSGAWLVNLDVFEPSVCSG